MLFSTSSTIASVALISSVAGMAVPRPNTSVTSAQKLFRRQDDPACLAPGSIADASNLTGQEEGTEGIAEGQAESLT